MWYMYTQWKRKNRDDDGQNSRKLKRKRIAIKLKLNVDTKLDVHNKKRKKERGPTNKPYDIRYIYKLYCLKFRRLQFKSWQIYLAHKDIPRQIFHL